MQKDHLFTSNHPGLHWLLLRTDSSCSQTMIWAILLSIGSTTSLYPFSPFFY